MDRKKIVYYVSTGLLSALMLMSAGMYFFQNPQVTEVFTALGYPTYIIYPLAIAKILGVIAIWSRASHWLKEWAYAGFFFDALLAVGAHLAVQDGEFGAAAVAIVLVLVSYFSSKRLYGS